MMEKTLIAYFSTQGTIAKIAKAADKLKPYVDRAKMI